MITDKVEAGFLPVYLRIAAELGPRARVLELGVYAGASLQMWKGLFPLGRITGVDNKPELLAIEHDDWTLVHADAADLGLPGMVGDSFDLIVDDCSHDGVQTEASFRMLWPLVTPGGYYVVEDWQVGLPDYPFKWIQYAPKMLEFVQALLLELNSRSAEAEEITYRYGLAVIRKRGASCT